MGCYLQARKASCVGGRLEVTLLCVADVLSMRSFRTYIVSNSSHSLVLTMRSFDAGVSMRPYRLESVTARF